MVWVDYTWERDWTGNGRLVRTEYILPDEEEGGET